MRNKFSTGNQYGNRNGRPRKHRALADNLRRVLLDNNADGVSNIEQICNDIIQTLTTHKTTGDDGTMTDLSFAQWFEMLKWLSNHIDGPVPQQLDMSVEPLAPSQIAPGSSVPVEFLESMFVSQIDLVKRFITDADQLEGFMAAWEAAMQPAARYLELPSDEDTSLEE